MENRNILILILIAISVVTGGVFIFLGLQYINDEEEQTAIDTQAEKDTPTLLPTANETRGSGTCPYVLTKFGAQQDITSQWQQNLTVNLDDTSTIRIVAFQCTATEGSACDTVASNAQISLNGAGISQTFTINGANSIPTVNLVDSGTIVARVTTPGYATLSEGCSAEGSIVVESKNELSQPATLDPAMPSTNSVCGDGICNGNENATICSADCITTDSSTIPATGVGDFVRDYGYIISGGILVFFGSLYARIRHFK